MKKNKLLCCDWGTSNFRLYLLDIVTTKVLRIVQSDQGIATTFDAWKKNGQNNRVDFYRTFLHAQIQRLATKIGANLEYVPIILSGMASSSIGMIEVPYTEVPFDIDEPNLSIKQFSATTTFPNELFIYGGLKTDQDVMRGEEVQLLGLSHLIHTESSICLLPGTHSKHIRIENKKVVDFQTFMTGECFDLLSKQSILKDSVNAGAIFSETQQGFFKKGLLKAQPTNLLNSLFSVRTNTLLKDVTAENNYHYLSGLLIGQELKALQDFKGQLLLNCSNHLAVIYEFALKTLQLDHQLTVVTKRDMAQCIPIAHTKLYQNI